MTHETHTFKKGDRLLLDQIYHIYGLIPHDSIHQDDIADNTILNDNDCGETVLFLKNVKIVIDITVS